MDTELFMECEEEELEPWQQVDDFVEEEEVEFIDAHYDPVEDSSSRLPVPETPSPTTHPTPRVPFSLAQTSSAPAPPPPPVVANIPRPLATSVTPSGPQAQPLILTRTPAGTFLLSTGPGPGTSQPILLTTQGFPVQNMRPVLNPLPQLVLNFQPGQTMQPVTLIQPPPLGQLVRPGLGVPQVLPQGSIVQTRPGTTTPVGLNQLGSSYTTLQIPSTLTIRTSGSGSTPVVRGTSPSVQLSSAHNLTLQGLAVNLQKTQIAEVNPQKLASCPTLPSGSTNGFNKATPTLSKSVPENPLSAPTSGVNPAPTKVVMTVEEFYYGTFDGSLRLRGPEALGTKFLTFTCQICSHQAEDNLRTATELHKKDGEVQVSTLLYSLGKKAEQVYKTFTFGADEKEDDYETVLQKLENYFVPKVNVIHQRAKFHQRIQRQVKKELDRMVKSGVTEEIQEPTPWCAAMVPVPKKNGEVRICVDLKQLNKVVKRKKYVLPTMDDILPELANAQVFSLLDAASGFWQLPLDEEIAKLTTFITPFGRYFFHRVPFGITSAPEIFQREMSKVLQHQEGVVVFMDDILVYANTPEEHEQRLQNTLQTLEEAGLQLNNEKCLLRQTQLRYLGHIIDKDGVRPDTAKVEAITQLGPPRNTTELRRVLGMVHYLGRYLPHLSEVTKPLNDLLRGDTAWVWSAVQDEAFRKVKLLISEATVLAFYDTTKPTIVSADASSHGLGGVLLQDHDGQLKPVAYCSRTLMDTDSFTLHTDHKPLVPLFNNKDLDSVPLRCQRLLMRMMRFNPTAEYVPGKLLVVADTLSRHPRPAVTQEIAELISDIGALEEAVHTTWPISPTKLDMVKEQTEQDEELQMVKQMMQHMLQHSEFGEVGGEVEGCCKHCYRLFSSPTQLATHQAQVHGPTLSSCICMICEWAFENDSAFLNHMKSNHKPGEMPYVCQVCSYRSSFYSDLYQHFLACHHGSRYLLCVFCLRVTRNPVFYQQHILRHKVHQAFHCNKCRLQFLYLKDKMEHKLQYHRSFRRPTQLEGLPSGTKVTIRTSGKTRVQMLPAESYFPSPAPLLIHLTNPEKEAQKPPLLPKLIKDTPKKSVSRKVHVKSRECYDIQLCMECSTDASDLTNHFPTHVHCLLCPYGTCCSRAYASHMVDNHVPRCKDKGPPLHRQPPPCPFQLQCSWCDFVSRTADQMAEHLQLNPEHGSSTCRLKISEEPDLQFFQEEEEKDRDLGPHDNLPEPSWTLAEHWKEATESTFTAKMFTQSSGPCHYLPRNSDAIDYFNLLFPSSLMKLITNETNAHAKTCLFLGTGSPGWTPVTEHEIRGFMGLVILMGIKNLPDPAHYWSWTHHDNSYTFYRAMSFKRFKQIAANIRMGSFITDEYRDNINPSDTLHIFRPMLDILSSAMWDAYQPNCCLTVDRALLPGLEEGQPIKGNPKTQPQVWLLCDSKSGYCHRFSIQMGERRHEELGFRVVPPLVEGLQEKHHQLYLASSLASVPLMQKLLDQGIYASSSFPPQSPILPRELWQEGTLDKAGDFLQRQFGPLLTTRWKDAKEMGCLSTNAAPRQTDTVWRRSQSKPGELDPIQRPMAFRLLQENMRGVDICKQLLACNPLGGVPLDRHWRTLFWFLVNLSIVNAFIVLRESRKDNPPSWVQDNLFSQVNFRKRLGNQLAKCAQKYFENVEIAVSRGMRGEKVDEPVKDRHKMGKISIISKRCKNCNLRNIRHESVYGCVICRANLCKQPNCFWEYHGMSPVNKGSIKIGFIRDRISGEIELDDNPDNIGDAMAPVEDLDFSDDEKMDDLDEVLATESTQEAEEETMEEVKHSTIQLTSTSHQGTVSPLVRDREDALTARQLRISLFTLCGGIRQACEDFNIQPQLIHTWLKEEKRRLKQMKSDQDPQAEGEQLMVEWVLAMREQQLPISENNLFQRAAMFRKKGAFSDSFRISYDWAVSFMLRHRLGLQSPGRSSTLSQVLPQAMEYKAEHFTEFTQKLIQVHKLPEGAIAAMDELCVFMDFSMMEGSSSIAQRAEALKMFGSFPPLLTVYLTVLANGTILPALLLVKGQLTDYVWPDSVLLESISDRFSLEQALELWTKKIWQQHLPDLSQSRKNILIVDKHREHLANPFLAALSMSGTLPAVIPAGCAFRLQPLDVCFRPVLQRFLLTRWAKFTAENKQEAMPLEKLQMTVTHLLVDWLVEAMNCLKNQPQFLKESFYLAGVFPGKNGEEDTQSPSEKQSQLLSSLAEVLLGPEALELESPDQLEVEDQPETQASKDIGEAAVQTQENKREGDTEMVEDRKERDKEIVEDREEGDKEMVEDRVEGDKEMAEDRKEGDKEMVEDRKEGEKEMVEDRREGDKEMAEDRKEGDKEMVEYRKEGDQEMVEDRKE
ncbi:uncharacterized protein pogzb [Lampris incognitus]|uniref:uncharacterized protein pogzb n=1 Tax=Lampris incognitus TaxID=2546036 RepID=UPI0024B527A0|nr:uncharacterized protein pogzb [Lampris incognitus]